MPSASGGRIAVRNSPRCKEGLCSARWPPAPQSNNCVTTDLGFKGHEFGSASAIDGPLRLLQEGRDGLHPLDSLFEVTLGYQILRVILEEGAEGLFCPPAIP